MSHSSHRLALTMKYGPNILQIWTRKPLPVLRLILVLSLCLGNTHLCML